MNWFGWCLVLTEIKAHLTKLRGPPLPAGWVHGIAAETTCARVQEPEHKKWINELADLLRAWA